jgi:hypothetical protein
MIDLLILAGIIVILLENKPDRRRAAGQLWGRARNSVRGLF